MDPFHKVIQQEISGWHFRLRKFYPIDVLNRNGLSNYFMDWKIEQK